MEIKIDDLTGPEVTALVSEHLRDLALRSPVESMHALDLEGLRVPDVTCWSVWEGDDVVGFGALKELDPGHGEIKSMRTATGHLRKGVASQLLQHMIDEAKRRGYRRLSLETGSMAAFEAARELYARFGFVDCEPFDGYVEDPNSVFMTREI